MRLNLGTFLDKILPSLFSKQLMRDYIRCPHCTTLYALYATVNGGELALVQCGTCTNTFNGIENKSRPRSKISIPKKINPFQPRLSKLKKPKTAPKNPTSRVDSVPNTGQIVEILTHKAIVEAATVAPATEQFIFSLTADNPTAQPIASSSFIPEAQLRTATQQKSAKSWILTAGSLLLLLNLVIFGWFTTQQDRLLHNTFLRPWLLVACKYIHCTLPNYRDPSKIIIQENQLISPDSQESAHFQLHALIKNTANYAQPLANLQININNLQGEKVNTLIFTPEQYVPSHPNLLLPPDETLHIVVDITDETPDIFSYDLKFL